MEHEDSMKEEQVRNEDMAERQRMETPDVPRTPAKDELRGRHGVDVSNFWAEMEQEDAGIEHSVDTDNLNEYGRLTKQQNSEVEKSVEEVQMQKMSVDQGFFTNK